MVAFIDDHRDVYGVEPICARAADRPVDVLRAQGARSAIPRGCRRGRSATTRCAARSSASGTENFRSTAPRKVWRQLRREGHRVARCTVERLMRRDGPAGRRARARRSTTTIARRRGRAPGGPREAGVHGDAPEPAVGRRLHVRRDLARASSTSPSSSTCSARRIVGWRVSTLAAHRPGARCARAGAVRAPDAATGLVHHSDRGVQYLSIRYTERLAEAGIEPSVGSVGDSYDNALAETVIGLFKTEVIRRRGPWRHVEAVEFATLDWVDWFNTRRLLEPIGYVPPAEYEAAYYREQPETPPWWPESTQSPGSRGGSNPYRGIPPNRRPRAIRIDRHRTPHRGRRAAQHGGSTLNSGTHCLILIDRLRGPYSGLAPNGRTPQMWA